MRIETVDDLVAALALLSDAKRLEFARGFDVTDYFRGRRHDTHLRLSERRALAAFDRLGDGSLSEQQVEEILGHLPTAESAEAEAKWVEAGEIIRPLAEALTDGYEPGIASLRPVIEWLEAAADDASRGSVA